MYVAYDESPTISPVLAAFVVCRIRDQWGDAAVTCRNKVELVAKLSGLTPRWAIHRKHNLKKINATDPFTAAIHNRQAKLILEITLASARESIRMATEIITRLGEAVQDGFLRHHLLAGAREVAAIEGVLETVLWTDEQDSPCLVRTLSSEIGKLERFYAGRIRRVQRRLSLPNFYPSWMAEIIFRLIARTVICDALVNSPRNAQISVRLWRNRETLCFSVEGIGFCTEGALLDRIDRPKYIISLLNALNGTFVSMPDGISIHMPVAACAEADIIDDATPFRR